MNEENTTEQLINEILSKFKTHDPFFNGKNIDSIARIKQVNIPNNERFPIVFSGGLAFLNNNFINLIEQEMKQLPSNICDLDNPDVGYIIPSKTVVEKFININKRENDLLEDRIINKSIAEIDDFANKIIISDIIGGNLAPRSRVKFITGKVGSGKSTFIEYFSKKNKEKFLKEKILNLVVKYEDIALEDFNEDIIENSTIKTSEKEKIFKQHIRERIYIKIVEEYFILIHEEKIEKLFYKDSKFSNIFASNACVKLSLHSSILSAKGKANYIKEHYLEYMTEIVKYIKDVLDYQFLVFFDGFDILNPKLINEFDFYIQCVKDIIYNPIEEDINIYYVLTLRNCTFQKFMQANVIKYHLIPANEDKIILRSLRLVARKNNFVKKYLDTFEKMFIKIIQQLEKNLSFDDYQSIVQIFDYNYRLLLDYFFQVLCYVISEYTEKIKEGGNTIKQFKQLIDDISINDYRSFDKFLESKFYLLNNILLNKNKLFHIPAYKIAKENTKDKYYFIESTLGVGRYDNNRNSSSFIDNIYNYLLPRKYFNNNSVFPLLFQFRLLQILDKVNHPLTPYITLDILEKELNKLGYKSKYIKSIVDNLINSKLIKFISDNTNNYSYTVRNRGRLIIRNLGLLNGYIHTIAPYVLLPYSIVDKINIKEKKAPEIVYGNIINTYIILNIIRDIELYELKNNKVLAQELSISGKLEENIINDIEDNLFHVVNTYNKFKNIDGNVISKEEYLEDILNGLNRIRRNRE